MGSQFLKHPDKSHAHNSLKQRFMRQVGVFDSNGTKNTKPKVKLLVIKENNGHCYVTIY